MLRTRGRGEPDVLVASNKVGMEADSVVYCGRSVILSPTGEIVAQAGSEFSRDNRSRYTVAHWSASEAVDGALNPIG